MVITVGEKATGKDVTIYMKSDGIHTDFIFPVNANKQDWSKVFLMTDTKANDSTKNFIAVGWGDQGFFLHTPEWSDLKFSTAFEAAFYLGKSAVHVNYLRKEEFPENVVELNITTKQYSLVTKYVLKTLKKKKSGGFDCIKNKGNWESDAFYQANGRYGMFHTCNSWINSGLKSADLPACLWTPFNAGIFSKY